MSSINISDQHAVNYKIKVAKITQMQGFHPFLVCMCACTHLCEMKNTIFKKS